jgi:formate hydrogenlyase transcriptional activator
MSGRKFINMETCHQAEIVNLGRESLFRHDFIGIIGDSEPLKQVLAQSALVAVTDTTILVGGETGTGKELLAQAIYSLSSRRNHPFIKVNCAALSATLIESELFGHEKGSFTGAITKRIGRFELADRATLFLDEVGELPLELQAKLLRALQEGEFERLGSSRTIKVDVRVIAATNQNLEEAVRQGKFRADLFYRLNVFPVRMPPLRERPDDISLLACFFVQKVADRLGKRIRTIPQEVVETLKGHFWPGNVRELKNVIERAAILTEGERLWFHEELLANRVAEVREGAHKVAVTNVTARCVRLEEVEREHISRVLERTYWRIEGQHGAASILGLNPGTLRSRMKKLGIKRPMRWS